MEPLVSVMMPARDCARWIGKAIESILEQTHRNLELVIVDDGSTDDTYNIAWTYAQSDSRIKVYKHSEPMNCPMSRNDCLDHCTGEFIARQDADDWSEPDRIQKQIAWLNEHPEFDAVSCWMMCECPGRPARLGRSCNSSVVAQRKTYDQIRFREVLDSGTDGVWNVECRRAGFKAGALPEPLYHYRFPRKGSVTVTRKKYWRDAIKGVEPVVFGMEKERASRIRQLRLRIPDIFLYKTLLYAGACPAQLRLAPSFRMAGYEIDVVELFEPSRMLLERQNPEWGLFRSIYAGDIRELDKALCQTYDVAFWWHGPEHVEKSELAQSLQQLEARAEKLAVIGCPHGYMKQGSLKGNPHGRHCWGPMPEDFAALGWEVDTLKQHAGTGSHLIAWKRM